MPARWSPPSSLIPARRRGAAGAAARATAQRRGSTSLASLLTLRSRLVSAARRPRPAPGAVPDRRRPQRRVHRADHLRRLHHQRLQRELHRARARDRPADAGLPALLPRHVPGAHVRHEPGAARQQHRPDVGGDRARHADHGADGRHLPHAARRSRRRGNISSSAASASRWRCSARSWSISRRARWSARASTRWPGTCWWRRRAAFDPALLNLAFVFLLLGYGTKVGLAPLHAWLPDAHAEGPDADLGRAVGAAAQRRALSRCCASRCCMSANPAALAPGPLMVTLGLLSRGVRGVHAVPAARHQAHVRLLLDRAHGDHHLRLRHGRAAGQLRRPAAHDACTA